MYKRFLSIMVVIIMAMALLAGCGGTAGKQASTEEQTTKQETATAAETNAQEPVTLNMTYWQPETKDIMEQMNTKFTEQNKNITIDLQQIPGDQYDKVLQTRFLTGDAPDVFFYFGGGIYQLASKGQVGEITNEPFVSNIIEGYKASATWEGKLYGVNLNSWAACVIYNKKTFEQAGITEEPKNYNEFLAACENLKKAGIIPVARGGKDAWTGSVEMLSLYGSTIANKYHDLQADRFNGKIKFTTSPYVKSFLTRYVELMDKGYMDKGALGLNHSQAAQQIADGKAAMFLGITVFWGDVLANNKEAELGAFLLRDDDGSVGYVGAPDKGICYSANGKHMEEAIKVLAFYATPEINKMYCDATQMFPCIKGTDVALAEPLKALMSEISGAQIVHTGIDFTWPAAATDGFRSAIQGIHAGKKDIDKILMDVDKAYDDNINTISAPVLK